MIKVSDNFKTAHIFDALVLEEAEQLVVDHCLSKMKSELLAFHDKFKLSLLEFSVAVASNYLDFVKRKLQNAKDEGIQLLYSYILLSRRYHQFYNAMQVGDLVLQEVIAAK